jgi:flagellar L-ring protein precursor FlgH
MKHNILGILIILFFAACASKEELTINLDKKPLEQIVLKQQPARENFSGSLYSRQGASLFADKKDLQIGDIIQVNILETLTNDSKNTRSLSKNNNTGLGGGILTSTGANNLTRGANKFNANLGIGFNTNTTNTFSGSTSANYDEEFETIISAIITQIYQNGNYSIKGEKEILINKQKQKMSVSGVIRPYDISPENSVSSAQIANLKILYMKAGDETDSLNKGWGSTILESIWPF